MYYNHKSWQEEVSAEITLEAQISELERRKRDLRCEICCLQYETSRLYSLYSQSSLALSKARYNYELNEYKLATVDGRLTVFEEFEAEKVKDKSIKTMLQSLSPKDRQALLSELEGMED